MCDRNESQERLIKDMREKQGKEKVSSENRCRELERRISVLESGTTIVCGDISYSLG
jgi:hypothetical protein